MSAALEPGMWVECVDARPFDWEGVVRTQLQLRAIYSIRDIVPDTLATDGSVGCGVRLHEVVLPIDPEYQTEPAFSADRFKPIYRPNSETFRSLLTPAPEVALEDA